MKTKLFVVSDEDMTIPVMVTSLKPSSRSIEETMILEQAGFNSDNYNQVLVVRLDTTNLESSYISNWWNNSTMVSFHKYIAKNFYNLDSGDIIDVSNLHN